MNAKYKEFETQAGAKQFSNELGTALGLDNVEEFYQETPWYDEDLQTYAIKIRPRYESQVVSIIGQEAYDALPKLVMGGPFLKPPSN